MDSVDLTDDFMPIIKEEYEYQETFHPTVGVFCSEFSIDDDSILCKRKVEHNEQPKIKEETEENSPNIRPSPGCTAVKDFKGPTSVIKFAPSGPKLVRNEDRHLASDKIDLGPTFPFTIERIPLAVKEEDSVTTPPELAPGGNEDLTTASDTIEESSYTIETLISRFLSVPSKGETPSSWKGLDACPRQSNNGTTCSTTIEISSESEDCVVVGSSEDLQRRQEAENVGPGTRTSGNNEKSSNFLRVVPLSVLRDPGLLTLNVQASSIDSSLTKRKILGSTRNSKTNRNVVRPRRKRPRFRKSKLHFCSLCDYTTRDDSSITAHLAWTHNRNATFFYCYYCPYKTKSKSSLRRHILRHITSEKKYKCKLCNYTGLLKCSLKKHFKLQHEQKRIYECKFCSFTTEEKSEIYRHSSIHKNLRNRFKCVRCPFVCNKVKVMDAHRKIVHSVKPVVFKCDRCSYESVYKENVVVHSNVEHGVSRNPYRCHDCKFRAVNLESFTEHIYIKHNPFSKLFFCAHCLYSTSHKHRLWLHWNSKHNVDAYIHCCKDCKFSTKLKQNLERHCNIWHNPDAVMYICHHCQFSTKIKPKLGQHMEQKHIRKRRKSE